MTKTLIITVVLLTFLTSYNPPLATECEIESIYTGIVPDKGTQVLTSDDEIEEIKLILVPSEIKQGNYVVTISRKGKNLYQIDNKDIYLKTKYCYEYATRQEVVIKVEGSYSYTKGKIIF